MDLNGKVVVITGASAGIGAACARQFSTSGATVVLAARRLEKLQAICDQIGRAGAPCLAVQCDVSIEPQVENLLAETLKSFGRVDIWINNAAYGLSASVETTTPEECRAIFDTNLMGVLYGCQAAARQMRKQGTGHIINVSSLVARFPLPLGAAYSATKGAVNCLTEAFALELEGSGIAVSLVMPGVTETEFTDAMIRKVPETTRTSKPGKVATAEQVAARIVRCAQRQNRLELFVPLGRGMLAIADIFPGLWRTIARRYIVVRTDGKGIQPPPA